MFRSSTKLGSSGFWLRDESRRNGLRLVAGAGRVSHFEVFRAI
jgi:hypothetical protein